MMMKDFYKFVISTLSVIAIVFIIDISFGSFLEKKAVFVDQPKYERIKQASEEVIVLGASRADNQYVTSIIESELGMTAYNYGVGAQNVFTNYAILNLLINKSKQKPRVVIWDFFYTDILDSPGWNTEKLYRLYSAYDYDDTIKEVINLQGEKKKILLSSIRLYKFNSKLPRLLIKEQSGGDKGYSPLFVTNKEPLRNCTQDRTNIDHLKVSFIDKTMRLCKANDIHLIVLISPCYYCIPSFNKDDWSLYIQNKCRDNNVPFFNFEQDSLFLAHPEWFYNDIHLNDIGAKEYTKRVAESVKSILN